MHWYKPELNGLSYACQTERPAPEWISGPPPFEGQVSNMIWDAGLGRVRAKTQAELDADAQVAAENAQAKETAKAALEAISPVALNQLAQGFLGQLDQVNLPDETKQTLNDLIVQAVGCIGHLRDLLVLSIGGSRV